MSGLQTFPNTADLVRHGFAGSLGILPATPRNAASRTVLYCYGKGVARISSKYQVTIPVAVLEEAGLHAGDQVVVEALEDGELRIRRGELSFERAFGALTDAYPAGYLEQLDREDAER